MADPPVGKLATFVSDFIAQFQSARVGALAQVRPSPPCPAPEHGLGIVWACTGVAAGQGQRGACTGLVGPLVSAAWAPTPSPRCSSTQIWLPETAEDGSVLLATQVRGGPLQAQSLP